MAAKSSRLFVPFGDLTPDGRLFRNEGLMRAMNVFPFADTYVPAPFWAAQTSALTGTIAGFHVHPSNGGWLGYIGNATKLYEFSGTTSNPWTVTDKTRSAGGNYSAAATTGWQGASFGDSVIMTNYTDDVQLLTSPSSSNFTKLAQSGGGSAGMDPKARFVFPVRNNLFLAYLNLGSGFDGLSSGDNPTVVAWSQTDNCRQYGSFNATPQLTGTGYQPLNYDLGYITGGVGGDYGIITLQRGIVRVDGPPFTFRPIVAGAGCAYPNSIVRFDSDVYLWGPAGPAVLRGGEGPLVSLTTNRMTRELTDLYGSDSENGFNYNAIAATVDTPQVSVAVDTATRTICWSYYSTYIGFDPAIQPTRVAIYDVDNDRFSTWTPEDRVDFLRSLPSAVGQGSWLPGRDLVAITGTLSGRFGKLLTSTMTDRACDFTRAYLQLNENAPTRITRVRPIYSSSASSTSVTITTKNRPYDVRNSKGPYSTVDSHGWVVTPGTEYGDFHRVDVTITGYSPTYTVVMGITLPVAGIEEMEGFELEFVSGGDYSA
jgi:hypothetical protein